MKIVLVGVLSLAVACKSKPKTEVAAGDCLPLPGASRRAITADPGGNTLYWIERVLVRDYDGIGRPYDRLVAYDLAAAARRVVRDRVIGPLFVRDGGVVAVAMRVNASLVWLHEHGEQSLLPDYFTVKDVEPIDRTRFAVLAEADGKRALYVLDLDNPRPVHLADATLLFGAADGIVYANDAEGVFAIDVATGRREKPPAPAGAFAEGHDLWFVEDATVRVQSMRGGEPRTVVADKRDWRLVHQHGAVLARFASPRATAVTYELAGGQATRLPDLVGGTSIVGTTRLGDATWALIGHNTSNYEGDLWSETHEADVCKLDRSKLSMTIATRLTPARFAGRDEQLTAALAKRDLKLASWQIFDSDGSPVTLRLTLDEDGGADVERLRDRVRKLHQDIERILDDRELVTVMEYRDGRTAEYRWQRDRLRGRAAAGIGDVLLSDPGDFDLAIEAYKDERDGDRIDCKGTVTNLRAVTLTNLQLRCIAGDAKRSIPIDKLEPKQRVELAKTFDAADDDYLVIEVFRGREPLVLRDVETEKRTQALFDHLVTLHADTGFALRAHDTNGRFYVAIAAPADLAVTDVARIQAVQKRLDTDARGVFGVDADTPLVLQVLVGTRYYDFDGERLTPVN